MKEERLQKFIASCGVTSRRKAEELIINGLVEVNGVVVKELGTKVNKCDVIKVEGKVINSNNEYIYIKLNKPKGYVTTLKDEFDRKTVIDLVKIPQRIYPIGRLDYNTTGLLLLTNDGELSNKLMHPKYNVYKTYEVVVGGHIKDEKLQNLRDGVIIDNDFKTSKSIVELIKRTNERSKLLISIHEGKNRQVRKMLESQGHDVINLKRISMGDIELGNLSEGNWEYLKQEEIKYLKKL